MLKSYHLCGCELRNLLIALKNSDGILLFNDTKIVDTISTGIMLSY